MSLTQEAILDRINQTEMSADPTTSEAIRNISVAMVEDAAHVKEDQKVLIWFDPPGLPLVKEIYLQSVQKGADVRFFMRDYEGDAERIADLEDEEIKALFGEEQELVNWAENIILVRNPENPEAMAAVSPDRVSVYFQRYGEVHKRRVTGDVDWTLFLWPTEYEAKKEGLSSEEYFKLVMKACNQPWADIHLQQAILKQRLDKAEVLEFHANEGDPDPRRQTHVTVGIKDRTFCNSTIDRNYPGSELFSAGNLYEVNGQIFAEGEYLEDGYLMKNIYLRIEKGRIIEAFAEEGNEGLQSLLDRDDKEEGFGSRYFGEVALGTNRGLTRRFFNPLLNEKVSGSFHMAIGHCYEMTEYSGDIVNVNNGNTESKTSLHWDLTILMHRKKDGAGGGRIVLDGETIQEDGFFKDTELTLLNPNI